MELQLALAGQAAAGHMRILLPKLQLQVLVALISSAEQVLVTVELVAVELVELELIVLLVQQLPVASE
jgi:hypothetical protein